MEEPKIVGDWIRERTLGSGGFGIVTLWRNVNSKDAIAVKKCRWGPDTNLSQKQKERWAKEVEMMQKIHHPNIIGHKSLPLSLQEALEIYNPLKLPILSMEFCEKGDLRQILNRAENCCGLRENAVRKILSDVSKAVMHLHSLKIIHRDIKPENIVLGSSGQSRPELVYKIVDLGYAKEMDSKSVCASFVGTLQYLAPELLYNKTYSCSVDYWSLGLIAFEIVCGVRPFLPNMAPAQWLNYAEKKSSEDICIYENLDQAVVYSKEIFPENHITPCLKAHLEKWLQIALEFDAKKRGHRCYDPQSGPNNELTIFKELQSDILATVTLTVYFVWQYRFQSYEIDASTLVSTLQTWIERDAKLEKSQQLLLCKKCKRVDLTGYAIQFHDEAYPPAMLYVYKKHHIIEPSTIKISPPPSVLALMEKPNNMLPYHQLKSACARGHYFISNENQLFSTFLDACHLLIDHSLLVKFQQCQEACKTMRDDVSRLVGQRELCTELLSYDFEQYLKRFSSNADEAWRRGFEPISAAVEQLAAAIEQISTRFESAKKRGLAFCELFKQTYSSDRPQELKALLEDITSMYSTVKDYKIEEKSKACNCKNLLKLLFACLTKRDALLKEKQFLESLNKITEFHNEIDKIVSAVENAIKYAEKYQDDLKDAQITRQCAIWNLVVAKSSLEPKKEHFVQEVPCLTAESSPKEAESVDEVDPGFQPPLFEVGALVRDNEQLRSALESQTLESLSVYRSIMDSSMDFEFINR